MAGSGGASRLIGWADRRSDAAHEQRGQGEGFGTERTEAKR